MVSKRLSWCAVACACAVSATALRLNAAETNSFHTALNSITATELGHYVDVLADDSFEGREAGSRGGRAAGGYLIQALSDNNIEPAGEDGGYYQSFGNGYRNVLGIIRGRDPQLQHEVIVVGAHYDHVGYGSKKNSYGPIGQIHNGADDNASGTAGVLEVMQAFTMLPEAPRRSIMFAFWDGEEMGLLGSKHWVSSPTVPLKQVVFAFNADMIGNLRNQRVEVLGSRTSPHLRRIVSHNNADLGLQLDFLWQVTQDSDHYSFYEKNIPYLMLHTGLHDYYHRPTDDAERINREGVQAVSQLLFRVAHEIAEGEMAPEFRAASRYESAATRAGFERNVAQTPPRLGVTWSSLEDGHGLTLTSIATGSAADRAGLRVGDRIVGCDGRPTNLGEDFRRMILAAGSDTQLLVERPGANEPTAVTVSLSGKPVRLGISWEQDVAEPSTVMLTQVVAGSAAEQAGLQARDRVYQVNGQDFSGPNGFADLVTHASGPIRLLIERKGVMQDYTIQPLESVTQLATTAQKPVTE